MGMLLLAAVAALLYARWRARDRRMLRNGVALVVAVGCGLLGITQILSGIVPGFSLAVLGLLLLLPASVLVLCGFLVANGVTMLRREGRRPANMLSLLAGLAIAGLPVLGIRLITLPQPWAVALAVLLFFASAYAGVAFLIVLSYAWVYGRTGPQEEPAAVVVLGSRLIDGAVPPLLRARLDRAVEIHRRCASPPLLIPSGGQGPDEPRPEGEAMAEHLRSRGIPEEDVVAETRALNTAQNLEYSRRIQEEAGRPGPMLAVTNDYHVLRTALLARKVGLRAEVAGAPTARYYVPSAFLREFVAVMRGHLFLHVLLFLPFLAATGLVLAAALQQ